MLITDDLDGQIETLRTAGANFRGDISEDGAGRQILLEDPSGCARSMTKMMSAHCRSSGVTGFSAAWFRPADEASIPGQSAKTCPAVGLRSRFWLQRKRTLRLIAAACARASIQGLAPLGDGMHEVDRNAVRTQHGRDLSLPRLEMLVLAFQLLAALVRSARRL